VRELISYLIEGVVAETRRRLADTGLRSADDIRSRDRVTATFPADVAAAEAAIKSFLLARMYRHPKVMKVMGEAEAVVDDLFARYQSTPKDLPSDWLPDPSLVREADFARYIGNFIAGMTDRYALIEHQRLFDSTPDLR
jgi:dGTPase